MEDQKVNRDFLKRASNGVDRLMKIVEDLDMITKLESGVMDLRITRMDLNEVVSESIASMEILAKEKDVRLINELGPQLLVKADRNRMVQVFINLFNNAINYGKPGGTCPAVRTLLSRGPRAGVAGHGSWSGDRQTHHRCAWWYDISEER